MLNQVVVGSKDMEAWITLPVGKTLEAVTHAPSRSFCYHQVVRPPLTPMDDPPNSWSMFPGITHMIGTREATGHGARPFIRRWHPQRKHNTLTVHLVFSGFHMRSSCS